MNYLKPEHWMLELIDSNEYSKVFENIDERTVLETLNLPMAENQSITFENRIEDILELALLEEEAEKEKNVETTFNMYQSLFKIYSNKGLPDEDISKIKHIYKLISYAYLGEKWESGRRILIENFSKYLVTIKESDSWDIKLFKSIYLSFVYLIKKENWKDLRETVGLINELRENQIKLEKAYLDSLGKDKLKHSAYELMCLYHLAKGVDLSAQFLLKGNIDDIRELLDYHFERAVELSEQSNSFEMNLIISLIWKMLVKMIGNSLWMITRRIDNRFEKFVGNITNSEKGVFELLYPQRVALLEQGLLDPAHQAIVVDMPTSSGKTLLAQFRIIQALNQFSDMKGWVVYIAPTRALVNQITVRLRKDLSPIGIKVEKMSGAIEIDGFEEAILSEENSKFDILVTTPEKFNLLIRNKVEESLNRPLVLTILDEAHNLEDESRGLNYELLMANIKNDCRHSKFLLLTPFIPNSDEISKWLDKDSSKDISIGINWKPNDRIIGGIFPEGRRRNWKTTFQTLLTSQENIKIDKEFLFSESPLLDETKSRLTKQKLSYGIAKKLWDKKGILIICRTLNSCWELAEELYSEVPIFEKSDDLKLVQDFIGSELGHNFILKKLLDKGIGVHHSGLPDDIRYLMEWLMEKGELKALISTTTIAQGINFPVSTIIMSSYSYPYTSTMPSRDFWNLVGRAGRTEQQSIGLVAMVAKDEAEIEKIKTFVGKNTEKLVSNLVKMIEEVVREYDEIDLGSLYWKPEWSQFLQFITHMYNQCTDLNHFNEKVEIFLKRTLGYNNLSRENQKKLVTSVKSYGIKLNGNKGLAILSDSTGFSFEALSQAMFDVKKLKLEKSEWDNSNLFSSNSSLKDLVGVMFKIPELKKNLEDIATQKSNVKGDTISELLIDWVSGKDIESLSEKYFLGNDKELITKCCKTIYGKLLHTTTWGLSSIQKLLLGKEDLTEEQRKKLSNLPAMIYYGVDTDEGILMRINNVPRHLANDLGKKYTSEGNDIYTSTSSQVHDWLSALPYNKWGENDNLSLNGSGYKKIWKVLNGEL